MTTDLTHRENGALTPTSPAPLAGLLTAPRPALAKALARAVSLCPSVAKDAKNEYHKYAYASAESIISAGRTALAEAELVLLPVESSLNGSEREGTDRFELVRTWCLLHSSGESALMRTTWPVCPDKGRPLDKATAAADTLSLSYLLRDLLLMPRVDPADDVAGRDDRPKQPAKGNAKDTSAPADGAQLESHARRVEEAWAREGLCIVGFFADHLREWAKQEHGCEEPFVRWPKKMLDDYPIELRALGKELRRTIDGNAQAALQAALAQKGRRWSDVQAKWQWASNLAAAELNQGRYQVIMAALGEMPDAGKEAKR